MTHRRVESSSTDIFHFLINQKAYSCYFFGLPHHWIPSNFSFESRLDIAGPKSILLLTKEFLKNHLSQTLKFHSNSESTLKFSGIKIRWLSYMKCPAAMITRDQVFTTRNCIIPAERFTIEVVSLYSFTADIWTPPPLPDLDSHLSISSIKMMPFSSANLIAFLLWLASQSINLDISSSTYTFLASEIVSFLSNFFGIMLEISLIVKTSHTCVRPSFHCRHPPNREPAFTLNSILRSSSSQKNLESFSGNAHESVSLNPWSLTGSPSPLTLNGSISSES